MSGIGRFIIFSMIATAVLWGAIYGIEWLSDRYRPQISDTPEIDSIIPGIDKVLELPDTLAPALHTPEEESRANLEYINSIRAEHGRSQIEYDARAYDLALARIHDTLEYNYRDHVNPHTGTCPYNMKGDYGFAAHEQVAENLAWIEGAGYMGPNAATDLWMDSTGHRHNLLYASHTGGATACHGGVCIFLGVNTDLFGAACATAAEGEAYWRGRSG